MGKENFLTAFETFLRKIPDQNSPWMNPIRRDAISRFSQLGFPTTRDEAWKYTSVEPIVKNSYQFPFEYQPDGLNPQKIEPFLFGQTRWNRLVFVNGLYSKELSQVGKLPAGVKFGSLAASLTTDSVLVEKHLSRYVPYEKDGFAALNTAFIQDGAFISVGEGQVLEEPIHLLFISLAGKSPVAVQPRNLILVGKKSRAVLVESSVSWKDGVTFTNGVTEMILDEDAKLDHTKIQKESESAFHVATTQVYLNRRSSYHSCVISSGAALARNTLRLNFDGEGAEAHLLGLYLASGTQHLDHTSFIDHVQPACTSRQLYKGIIDGKARGVFAGKILVRKNAQKTDAKQTNKNLLLSQGATVDTKPQLEIFADDVKCAHGAAVGQLDEAALFYLRSRGIGGEEARYLLTYGFASEVIHQIKTEPIRSEVDRILLAKLQRKEFSKRFDEGTE